jgi:hypothetical protein
MGNFVATVDFFVAAFLYPTPFLGASPLDEQCSDSDGWLLLSSSLEVRPSNTAAAASSSALFFGTALSLKEGVGTAADPATGTERPVTDDDDDP